MKTLWIDTETTGLDCKVNAIVQLSCLVEVDGEIIDSYDANIKPFPEAVLDEKALEVTGKNELDFIQYPEHTEGYKKFKDFLNSHINPYDKEDKFIIAGYNVQFDIDFVGEMFRRNKDSYLGSYLYRSFFDVLYLVGVLRYKGLIPPEELTSTKLQDIAYYFGVEREGFHSSLVDINVTRDLAIELSNVLIEELK